MHRAGVGDSGPDPSGPYNGQLQGYGPAAAQSSNVQTLVLSAPAMVELHPITAVPGVVSQLNGIQYSSISDLDPRHYFLKM